MGDGCQVNKDSQISKNLLHSVVESFKSIKENTVQDQILITPVGKLKSCLEHWKAAGANQYILDVVEHGYELPFRNIPSSVRLKNNKSARDNPKFASGEIKNLLLKGCVTEFQETPYIVNPLTVAYGKSGKPRLVLDCRHINLELFKYKCCFEDQSVAKQLFTTGDYLFSFDIRSAYHHIMIFQEHKTYLCFSWECDGQAHYDVFNVPPFGISTADFIFTKVLRVVVTKWRSQGFRTVLFLDDGLSGESTYTRALQASQFMHQDLIMFGFLIAEDKCHWEPCQSIVWLGYLWDTCRGIFMVTEDRIQKTERLLKEFMEMIGKARKANRKRQRQKQHF
ncbi:uncharacterized protein LOC128556647 [Mercenaria mercenaria]|uniref:uncharacterized protein LOC128556647 n=1 Tax=Mercenaria mercenaria TaxID=6596 RepID=UPI00234F7DC0|nr:uncharacterized protein LOC128556647 [Mercenaria mercenaria]